MSSRRVWSFIGLVALAALMWWVQSDEEPQPCAAGTLVACASPTPTPADVERTTAAPEYQVDLPPEALETIELIDAGGPFPYDRDGVVFENRERLLPQHPRGYYREYTVPTPGEDDRGARRLVEGDGGELYYTDDHYASFEQVRE